MLESGGFTEFKLDYAGTNNHAIGDIVRSDDFSVGGHVWRVNCFPYGDKADQGKGFFLSLKLQLVSGSKNVKAIFQCFVVGRDDGEALLSLQKGPRVRVYNPSDGSPGQESSCLIRRCYLEQRYLTHGFATFMIGVIVPQPDNPIPLPASDIACHLGRLLDHGDGSDDVTFSVGSETFRAHRVVLAARSPFFKAQLFGSMADATMRCITLHDLKPETFRILLRFIYTDELPRVVESSSDESIIDFYNDLLAAADMYQLDRLKLMCSRKLWECVSAETVAKVLGCAELYSCLELKRSCLDFLVVQKNFKIAVLTEGYFQLMPSFPSLIDEIRARLQRPTIAS